MAETLLEDLVDASEDPLGSKVLLARLVMEYTRALAEQKALGADCIPEEHPVWAYLREWLDSSAEQENELRRKNDLPIIHSARDVAAALTRAIKGLHRAKKLTDAKELVRYAETHLRARLNPDKETLRKEALALFKKASAEADGLFNCIRLVIRSRQPVARIAAIIQQAYASVQQTYEAGFSHLNSYLLVAGRDRVEQMRLGLSLSEVREAANETLLILWHRHENGCVVDADHLVNLAAGIMLTGDKTRGIPTMIEQKERAKRLWSAKHASLDQPVAENPEGQTLTFGETLAVAAPSIGSPTAATAADSIQLWDAELEREGSNEEHKAKPVTRFTLKSMRIYIRWQLANHADSPAAFPSPTQAFHAAIRRIQGSASDNASREALLDQANAALNLAALLPHLDLAGLNLRLGEMSNRGFELRKELSEFLQLIHFSAVDAQAQNNLKKRLKDIVLLLRLICDKIGSDIFGVREWADTLERRRKTK